MQILPVIGNFLLLSSMALTVAVLLWILQLHSFCPGAPVLNSTIEQRLNMAKSNAGLVPTNILLSDVFVCPSHMKFRLIKLGYGIKQDKIKLKCIFGKRTWRKNRRVFDCISPMLSVQTNVETIVS